MNENKAFNIGIQEVGQALQMSWLFSRNVSEIRAYFQICIKYKTVSILLDFNTKTSTISIQDEFSSTLAKPEIVINWYHADTDATEHEQKVCIWQFHHKCIKEQGGDKQALQHPRLKSMPFRVVVHSPSTSQ